MSTLTFYQNHKEIIRRVLFIAGLLFVFVLVLESWGEIERLLRSVKPLEFTLSVVTGLLGTLTISVFFNRLLGKNGVVLSDRLAIKIYLVGQIAKYIPGKIWGIAYQISHVAGARAATGVVLANMENMFIVIYMTSMTAFVLVSLQLETIFTLASVIGGLVVFLLLYRTRLVLNIVHLVLKTIGQQDFVPVSSECIKPGPVEGVLFCVIFCSTYALSYILMLDAVFNFPPEQAYVYIVLLSIAWIGGVLTIIVPAGMGVRELIFVSFTSQLIPDQSMESIVSIAVVTRAWQLLQELAIMPVLFSLRREQ